MQFLRLLQPRHDIDADPEHRRHHRQCYAERGILEFSFADHEPGLYMFHAHQAEFTELGCMANFNIVDA